MKVSFKGRFTNHIFACPLRVFKSVGCLVIQIFHAKHANGRHCILWLLFQASLYVSLSFIYYCKSFFDAETKTIIHNLFGMRSRYLCRVEVLAFENRNFFFRPKDLIRIAL